MTEKIGKKIMKTKTIALIAHDNKKPDIIRWAEENKAILSRFNLCGTGTTAKLIAKKTGLTVQGYLSGPLGGDLEIGAKVAKPLSSAAPTLSPRGKARKGNAVFYNADKSLKKSEKDVIINPIQ